MLMIEETEGGAWRHIWELCVISFLNIFLKKILRERESTCVCQQAEEGHREREGENLKQALQPVQSSVRGSISPP